MLKITVRKWELFNTQSARSRTPYWFRVNKDIMTSPGLIGLNAAQCWVWICLLSLCCSENSKTVCIKTKRLAILSKTDEETVIQALEILKDNLTIELFVEPTQQLADSKTPTIQYNTHNTIPTNNTILLVPAEKKPTPGSLAFESYSLSYQARYKVVPVRNQKINALFKQLHQRLGEDAKVVAGFYVSHNDAFYVRSGHAVELLVRDAEKLRTEWATGQKITGVTAREVQSLDHNATVVKNYLEKTKEGKNEREVLEESANASPRLPTQPDRV